MTSFSAPLPASPASLRTLLHPPVDRLANTTIIWDHSQRSTSNRNQLTRILSLFHLFHRTIHMTDSAGACSSEDCSRHKYWWLVMRRCRKDAELWEVKSDGCHADWVHPPELGSVLNAMHGLIKKARYGSIHKEGSGHCR